MNQESPDFSRGSVKLEHIIRWVHDAIAEGLDRECDDVGEGALCQHIALWVFEAMESEQCSALRVPRVWLPGDTVPAGTWVQDVDGDMWLSGLVVLDEGPYVEVHAHGQSAFAAAVAAEQARRAATEVGDP